MINNALPTRGDIGHLYHQQHMHTKGTVMFETKTPAAKPS